MQSCHDDGIGKVLRRIVRLVALLSNSEEDVRLY